jgi:hypothetical protein
VRARSRARALLLAAASLSASACGGIKTVSRDGYRALLVFSSGERYQIAVAGEKGRVEGPFDGSTLVKILRPDLRKVWQFRPATRKILEAPWSQGDELVPGYPLEPRFDPAAYAQRFNAEFKQIGDGVHGIHPCDRYQMTLPSEDRVTVWAARDLERLPVRVEHQKKNASNLFDSVSDTQLLDARIGADEKLFEKPRDYKPVQSYSELSR